MNAFLDDVCCGTIVGLKISLTAYAMFGIVCLAFTGFGVVLAAPMMPMLLDLIWGE